MRAEGILQIIPTPRERLRVGVVRRVKVCSACGRDRGRLHRDLTATVGGTPLVELGRLGRDLPGRVAVKLEMRNPGGSVKDRLAVALIDDAERRGVLTPGMTIVEATGGNTGIGLAFVAAVRGYRLRLTMPETMSRERVALLSQLGAGVELTPGILMGDAVQRARCIVGEFSDAVALDQFSNPANPEIHRRTTGPEIWADTQGEVDVFVATVGTGGTITGVGQALKQRKPSVEVMAVEPAGCAVLSGGAAGEHQIPGIGVGFVPAVLDRSIIDEVIAISDHDAFCAARRLAREEGILAGVSSGAAIHAALTIAARDRAAGKLIVALLADTGERYITTQLFPTSFQQHLRHTPADKVARPKIRQPWFAARETRCSRIAGRVVQAGQALPRNDEV